MPDFNTFWAGRGKAHDLWDDPNRAVKIWNHIQDHPTSVTLKRGSTVLDAQTVLATQGGSTTATSGQGDAGTPGKDRLLLIGVRGHPDTDVDDFDVQRGDIFRLYDTNWRVEFVHKHEAGKTEAFCEGQQ